MTKQMLAILALGAVVACTAAARAPSANEAPAPVLPSAHGQAVAPVAQAPAPTPPQTTPHAASHAMTCDIRTTRTENGVAFRAIAQAPHALSGEYELTITQSGAGGSSDIVQGGPFSISRAGSVTLSESELSIGSFRATLRLRDATGELCRHEIRS